ncbi:MAG: hypothetical protein K0M67_21950 [Thiobacillus sp.]|nr:hypothetical protein [Thiobacillus sp.]
MNTHTMLRKFGLGLLSLITVTSSWSFTPSTQPPQSTAVPGNVLLALSVEFPTGLQVSYTGGYSSVLRYDGYFDNRKCYTYNTTSEVFSPTSATTGTGTCGGTTEWSGNVLNWLTMTNLDQFRSVMTGGTRDDFSGKALSNSAYHGDTTNRTILIRSFSDRNAYNPDKTLPSGASAPVPTAFRGKNVRSGGYGSKFIASDSGFPAMDTQAVREQSCSQHSGINRLGCFNIRVEVCVAVTGVPREDNCQAKYSGVAKPEGLIQQYANTLRFGAFGYLNETGNDRSGGVLRSAMKSVGPVAATKTGVITNPNPEWNTTSGIMFSNPDPTDATANGVTNSGLMNYLNKFGYAEGYKGNDPVSELFYAAQRYMRGYALPDVYTNNLNAAGLDGFPVITGDALTRGKSRDPMINTCQKNFMLAIGDIYTHCDGDLPGSTNSGCTGGIPSDPDSLNVQTLWNTLRGMEGMPDARDSTGVNGWAGGSGTPTPYVAGLAHWANTNDIRSDLTGEQNISTYFVDVLELSGGKPNGVADVTAASKLRTQYWLAAKYGGFDRSIESSNNPNTTPASWDADSNGVPDTWFAGSTPALLKSGLSSAFADISAKSSVNSASSAAVTSSRQTSSSQIIYAGYDPQNWSGTVRACKPTQTADECRDTPDWEASRWFKTSAPTLVTTPLTATSRKIFTSWRATGPTGGFSSTPFLWASLNADQKAKLQPSDTLGEDRSNYLRGDRTNEVSVFRKRHEKLLGDIVNSGVNYVSGPGPALFGANFAGHADYRLANKNRPAVVYVGGNDGMLHAFAGTDGKELFGYIPGAVYDNLAGLSALNFQHRYFVDSTPMTGDFQKTASTWGTMLVGGLGAGGKGFYALDITNQKNFTSMTESALSAIPMWEFTAAQDADLGYTFNEPSIHPVSGTYQQIAKVVDASDANGVWRVIVGNGFGATTGDAVLFMLNANTGAAALKLQAVDGTTNGLATPTPVDTDRDGLIDTVYAGDLEGNLHKFQFSMLKTGNYVVAKYNDTGAAWRYIGKVYATGQPITTAPSVEKGADGWIVSFGTGKLNEDTDYTDSTSVTGFYSVLDNNPSSSLTVPASDLATITYTSTSLGNGLVGRTWPTPDMTDKKGWKMAFTGGERVLSNSTLPPDTGVVLFATTKPSGDVCDPGNTGFIMAVNLSTGKSNNLLVNGNLVGGLSVNSTGVIKVSNTYADQEKDQVVVCNQDGCKPKKPEPCDPATNPDCKCLDGDNKPVTCGDPPSVLGSGAPKGRYNWREILTK